jgi:hypothetical protein
MAIQQGRRGGKTAGVALSYVEDFDEPRTKLGAFFSIR